MSTREGVKQREMATQLLFFYQDASTGEPLEDENLEVLMGLKTSDFLSAAGLGGPARQDSASSFPVSPDTDVSPTYFRHISPPSYCVLKVCRELCRRSTAPATSTQKDLCRDRVSEDTEAMVGLHSCSHEVRTCT